jgi:hypothetical protein
MPKKSTRSMVWTAPPERVLIRNVVLTACMTWSGPTATNGSGGSPSVAGREFEARPANDVASVIAGSVFVVARAGAGATLTPIGAATRSVAGRLPLGTNVRLAPLAAGSFATLTSRSARRPPWDGWAPSSSR